MVDGEVEKKGQKNKTVKDDDSQERRNGTSVPRSEDWYELILADIILLCGDIDVLGNWEQVFIAIADLFLILRITLFYFMLTNMFFSAFCKANDTWYSNKYLPIFYSSVKVYFIALKIYEEAAIRYKCL